MTSAKTTTQDPPGQHPDPLPAASCATTRIRRYGAVILLPCSAACAGPEGVIGAAGRVTGPGWCIGPSSPAAQSKSAAETWVTSRAAAGAPRRRHPPVTPRDELGLTGPTRHLAAWAAPVLLPGRSAVEIGLDQLPRPARSRWSWQGVANLSASVMFAWQLLER
jgi:hypothetical protein